MRSHTSITSLIGKLKTFISGSGLKSKLVRDGIGSLILRFFVILLSFFMSVVLARTLGADGYGIYSYVFAIVSILSIPAEFGLPTLVLRETAKNITRENWGLVKGIWQWSSRVVAVLTIVMFVMALATFWIIGDRFGEMHQKTFLWGLILIPLVSLGHLRGAALKGLKKVILGQLPDIIITQSGLIIFVSILAFIFAKKITPDLAMGLYGLSATIGFLVGGILLWKFTPQKVREVKGISQGKKWLQSAVPLALVNGVAFFNKWISIVILGLFVSSAEVGIFRVAVQISILASSGLQVVNLVVAPQFASFYAQGDMQRLQRLATMGARAVLLFNLLVTTFFVFFGKIFLNLVYGEEYVLGFSAMLILLVGQFFNSATGSVAFLLNMTDREKLTIRGTIVAVVTNVALNFWLSPIFGINGSAIATAVSVAFSNIILWWLVKTHLGINSLALGKLKKK
jgi:O-antigen/teichoic acid export membrane protein